MNSSTSSSKLIVQSFASFLVLTVGYVAFVGTGVVHGGSGTNQWQNNVIKAERYQYAAEPVKSVVTGSSMAYRLLPEYLGTDYSNIAFAGGGALTGLQVILQSKGALPSTVFVEMNDTLLRGQDKEFIQKLTSPVLGGAKSTFAAFRTEYQPVILFKEWIKGGSGKEPEAGGPVDPDILASELARHAADHAKAPDPKQLQAVTGELKQAVDTLRAKGVQVVLFEPPSHRSLHESVRSTALRKHWEAEFPKDRYDWAQTPNPDEYETGDGIHMTGDSARKYAAFLKEHLGKKIQSGS
ncbi:hypothetical protein [Paenibacillus mucilaginosus]|uniref:hypothetical protein n=1 Tax=Paenibacillus mucilaginosus TaxID=61624 RepID=UPI001F3C4823|nr:hypothetical protein [Paenibacillus mucilaginosus]